MRRQAGKMFVIMLCVAFGLAACSVEPGGTADPEDFKTELTPPANAEEAAAQAEDAGPSRLDELERNLGFALERIDRLELAMSSLEHSISAIEAMASQALTKAKEGPLDGIDLSDEAEAGKVLMQQSLEQIIGISRLLLDKMEDKLAGPNAGPEAAPESQQAPDTQVQ